MSGRNPDQIWDDALVEGRRRLSRTTLGLLATGTIGGMAVMLGLLALAIVSGAVEVIVPGRIAHVAGSLFFGIGFVVLIVGRSELFTENFLIPVGAVIQGEKPVSALMRLWLFTLAANLVGVLLLAWLFTRPDVLPPEALDGAGRLADEFAERSWAAAGLSAVLAGMVMTVFTWMIHAVESGGARILLALLIGVLLALPRLNHSIVSVGEMSFGVMAGTAESARWIDLAWNFPLAVAGNLVGGLLLVTLLLFVQVRGEPRGDRSLY